MRICITGGFGYIGSWITRCLVGKGLRPVVLSRHGDMSLLPDCAGKFDFAACDIQDAAAVSRILAAQGAQAVVHAAAMGNQGTADGDPLGAVRVNALGTSALLEAAGRHGVRRFIYLSSGSIYDPSAHITADNRQVIREDSPIRPAHIVHMTKWFGEEAGRYFARRDGFEFAAIRASSTYGPLVPGRKGQVPMHMQLLENAVEGRPTAMTAQDAQRIEDRIYLADLAEGIVAACLSERLPHDAYNLGSGRGASLREFAEAARQVFPEAQIDINGQQGAGGAPRQRIFDISRAREDLGFDPRHDLVSGIRDYRKMRELFNSSNKGAQGK